MRVFILGMMIVFSYGANLINVNFFELNNKIDVLFSLDDKFKGKVLKVGKNSYVITDVVSKGVIQKSFSNSFISSIIVSPYEKSSVKVDILSKEEVKVGVSLTPDGYGIRFRVYVQKDNTNVSLPTKETNIDIVSYLIVMFILFVIALALLIYRKKAGGGVVPSSMKILLQKPIDSKNKLVLVEFQERKYLLVIGNSNLLLEKFDSDFQTPKSEVEFDEMLKLSSKYDNIEEYIKKAEKLQNKDLDERV